MNQDFTFIIFQFQNLKGQVVQTIRHNQQLVRQLNAMDVKIGLLVHNRITLQVCIMNSMC
jgi:hypothetical protein